MKLINAILLCLISSLSHAQLSGDIKEDNRELLSVTDFKIESNSDGVVVFEIAVNAEGEVTSANLLKSESTLKSTPKLIKAKKEVMSYTFEKGTHYPKYHQGKIKIVFVRKS